MGTKIEITSLEYMNKSVLSFLYQTATLSLGWLLPLHAQSPATLPANWQRVSSVSASPDSPTLKTTGTSGNLLIGNPGEPYTIAQSTPGDFKLTMDVLMTPGADAVLLLPSGPPVKLGNTKVSKAPGLWETVEVMYRAGHDKRAATLEKLAINDVTIAEGEILPVGKQTGAVGLDVKTGSMAVRNVNFRPFANRDVARWTAPLSYTVYENANVSKREDLATKKVLKQDTTSLINYEVAYGLPRQFAILFAGKLNTLQAGDYQFELHQGGIAGLWVDGKEVVPTAYRELGQPGIANASLTAGPHDVQVFFVRSWPRPGLGVFVSQAGTRLQPLHALASLPDPDPVSLISVQADAKPQLIRSFVQVPGEKKKRTHSLSVGSPAGLHYTLDLNQMALLQAWKGDFANATEMWHERGEPQLLTPMGATVQLAPQTALMVLPTDESAWPDSVGENTLQYKGLVLDKQGFPTIEYSLAGATVTDAIRTTGNSLDRTLTITGSPTGTAYCRVAAGSSVEEVGKGLYAVGDRSYYVRIDPKAKVKLRQSNGKQEILLPVLMKNGAGSVQYSIVF